MEKPQEAVTLERIRGIAPSIAEEALVGPEERRTDDGVDSVIGVSDWQ